VQSGKPLVIIAEDVEGEALGHAGRQPSPRRPEVAPSRAPGSAIAAGHAAGPRGPDRRQAISSSAGHQLDERGTFDPSLRRAKKVMIDRHEFVSPQRLELA